MGDWWFYVPWSVRVRAGGWRVDGMKVSRKLSALELVGPLAVVAAGVGLLRNRRLIIWVDNAGSVAIWKKGYSNRCRLCTTLVAAIAAVEAAVGCVVELRKVARCSDVGSQMADHLSRLKREFFGVQAAGPAVRLAAGGGAGAAAGGAGKMD